MNFREKQAGGAYERQWRRRGGAAAAKGWTMVMFPCRKLHYFIHAVPRRDWRKHCVPSTANFHMQNVALTSNKVVSRDFAV